MDVTFIALGLLACAWAVLLLPDLRNRGGSSGRANSVQSFRDQLSGLDRTRPSPYGRPVTRSGAGRRPAGVRTPGPAAPTARHTSPVGVTRPGARPVVTRGSGGRANAGRAGSAGRSPGVVRPVGVPVAARAGFVPRSSEHAARRRRVVLLALVGLAVVTLVGGLVGPRSVLGLHLVVDVALAAYAYLLGERASQVRRRVGPVVLRDDDLDDPVLHRKAAGS